MTKKTKQVCKKNKDSIEGQSKRCLKLFMNDGLNSMTLGQKNSSKKKVH